MNFLYFQDFHLTPRQPLNRLDNYQKTQLNKLAKVFDIARTRKVHEIICGGDFLDRHSEWDTNFLAEVFCIFLANKDIKFKVLLGNHCLIGYNLESYRSGILGMFVKLGFIEIFDNNAYEGIKGIPYTSKIPTKFHFPNSVKGRKILLIHNMLLPNGTYPFDFYPLEKFETNVNLVLLSHYHHPFYKQVGNTHFVNIGSFGRLNIKEVDIMPSVGIIDTDGGMELIEVGEVGSKVFKEKVEQSKDVNAFVQKLPQMEFHFQTVHDVLSLLEIDDSVRKECVKRLGEAERSLL